MDTSAIKAADAKVRDTVEEILADIDARKDAAVRELSRKFDNWSPASFKLAPSEVERAIGQVHKRDLDTTSDSRKRRCATSHRSKERRYATSK
jgi:sulfopropanediol 3-dehydrogenase